MNWLTSPECCVLTTILVPTLIGSHSAVAQVPRMHPTALWASASVGPTLPYEWAVVGSAGFRYTRVLICARYAITFENPGARIDDVGIVVGVIVTPSSQRTRYPSARARDVSGKSTTASSAAAPTWSVCSARHGKSGGLAARTPR